MELPLTICEGLSASSLLAGGAVGTEAFAVAQSWGSSASICPACQEDRLPFCLWLFRVVFGRLVLCSVAGFDRQAASESLGDSWGHGLTI